MIVPILCALAMFAYVAAVLAVCKYLNRKV